MKTLFLIGGLAVLGIGAVALASDSKKKNGGGGGQGGNYIPPSGDIPDMWDPNANGGQGGMSDQWYDDVFPGYVSDPQMPGGNPDPDAPGSEGWGADNNGWGDGDIDGDGSDDWPAIDFDSLAE